MKVGIVGCGSIASSHVDAYKSQGCEIIGVTDSNADAAKSMAAGLPSAVVYDNFQDLIDKGCPEAISICSPPRFHEEAAVYALAHGVNVLCEKPMAYDTKSAYAMRDAAEKSKALLMPAFRHRFLPAIRALRDLVTSGTIGDVVLFNNIFCGPAFAMEGKWFTKKAIAGGGTLFDTNSHSVDLFRFIVGEVVDQKAIMHRHFATTDVEDAGILLLKSDNNAIGSVESAFVAGAGVAFIDIIGKKGRAYYDYDEPESLRYRLTKDKDWTVKPVVSSWGFDEEITHFIAAIKGQTPLECTVNDGVRAVEIICSVY